MEPVAGIVFDLDGVILESVDLKAQAFRRLFAAYPEHLDEIVRLHLENGGLSRYEKLRRIYRDYLRLPLTEADTARLDAEYRALVADDMQRCPFVAGADTFIRRRAAAYPLFIASGTPEEELRALIDARGLGACFTGVYGSPCPKTTLLGAIVDELAVPAARLVFIGDTIQDYEAAAATAMRFVGREPAGQASPFPSPPRLVLRDLNELETAWADLTSVTPYSRAHPFRVARRAREGVLTPSEGDGRMGRPRGNWPHGFPEQRA
jgi:phosphoglycolate phosphatase-like HAD superfamily hydrolase